MSVHTDMAYSQAAKRREAERRAQKMPLAERADRAVAGPYWDVVAKLLLIVNVVLWGGFAYVMRHDIAAWLAGVL